MSGTVSPTNVSHTTISHININHVDMDDTDTAWDENPVGPLLPPGGLRSTEKAPTVDSPQQPRLAVYDNVNTHSDMGIVARRFQECVDHVALLHGVFDASRDHFRDNTSANPRGTKPFHSEMERLLVEVSQGRYDGVVMWQLPGVLTVYRNRAAFQRVMVNAGSELHVVISPRMSLYGPVGELFGL